MGLILLWGGIGAFFFFSSKHSLDTLSFDKKLAYGPAIWMAVLIDGIINKKEKE